VESDPIGLYGGNFSTYAYANSNPVSIEDPSGLVNPGELACLGGPNPVCDVSVVVDVATAVAGASAAAAEIIDLEKARQERDQAKSASKVCPQNNDDDNGCERDQKALLSRRLVLTNLLRANLLTIQDYAQKANAFNRDAAAHNARCRNSPVAPMPIGPRGL